MACCNVPVALARCLVVSGASTCCSRTHCSVCCSPRAENAGESVLLVGIDAASERARGRPFGPSDHVADWRRDHARLIERAARAGANAVVFDMFFERATDADDELAVAARNASAERNRTRVAFGVRRIAGDASELPPMLREVGQSGSLCLIDRGGGALWAAPLAIAPRESAGAGEGFSDAALAFFVALVGEPLRAADLSRRELRFDGRCARSRSLQRR